MGQYWVPCNLDKKEFVHPHKLGAGLKLIGRWSGDRIALVGDYAQDSDLPAEFKASEIWDQCLEDDGEYTDISSDVCAVIEHELNGCYAGSGWRHFKYHGEE